MAKESRELDEERYLAEDESTPEYFDPESKLPGAVLMVPNSRWGFRVESAEDHPGACIHYQETSRQGILLKGTDAAHGLRNEDFLVDPTDENGLRKPTAFRLVPRPIRLHILRLYYAQRLLGHLADETLRDIRHELARLHPED